MSNKHEFKDSSSIRHCDYDDEKGELIVCFTSGATYHYPQVKRSIYEALKQASSPGSFFHKNVKPHFTGIKQ